MGMNQLYLTVGLAVGIATVLGFLWRGVKAVVKLAAAGAQLVTAVGDNTLATRDLSGRLTAYQDATDARLEALEHRRFL